MRTLAAVVLGALTLLGCDDAAADFGVFADLEESLELLVVQQQFASGAPGMIIGVWIPGDVPLVVARGVADRAIGTPLDGLVHFRIGGITASFTATVALQLVDEGLLRLDDTVGTYLPGIENADATIAELATMRSGIFNYTDDAAFTSELITNPVTVWPEEELVAVANRNAPYFPPGDAWHYANTNAVALGMIIEHVTGRPLAESIQKRILEPLGLAGTGYPSTPELPSLVVRGYSHELEDVTLIDPSAFAGSGAMYSTLRDLMVWGNALGRGALLSTATQTARLESLHPVVVAPCVDDVETRPRRRCPAYDRYGLGIGEISGWIGHTGELAGYSSLVMYEPTSGAVVVILTNISGVGEHVPTTAFRMVAEILNPRLR